MLDLEACAIAGEMLREAGFEHRRTSMQSEATYYALPGRVPVLRVACHKAHRAELDGVPVIAMITFNANNFKTDAAGLTIIPRPYLVRAVAIGIGNYMLASAGVVRARARYRDYWRGGDQELASVAGLDC